MLAAYDLCLKCSHLFNLLDARGAISVTERARFILRVRTLARGVAQATLTIDSAWDGLSVCQAPASNASATHSSTGPLLPAPPSYSSSPTVTQRRPRTHETAVSPLTSLLCPGIG